MSPLARIARLSTPVRAAGLIMLAGVGFACMITLIRHLATNLLVDPLEIIFFRNLFASIGMLPWLMRNGVGAMKTRRLPLVSLRVFFGLISMATWFSALAIVPIANAVALSFTAPLFAAVAAVLVLGEKIRARRITALLLGFGGMLVILRPGHAAIGWGEVLVVISAMTMAFSIITMKLLTRTEKPAALVAWQNMLLTPVSLVPALFVWAWPSAEAWACLAAVGFIATLSHLCFTRGFSMADTTYLLPFDYIRLPLVAVMGWFAFGEATDIWTWVGAAIIAASTFYVARREALARQREAAPEGKGPARYRRTRSRRAMNRFDVLALDGGGRLLLSAFPGDETVLDRFAEEGAGLVISLTTGPEMTALGLPPARLAAHCRARGMAWRHMSIADMGVAGAGALEAWREIGPLAHGLLDAGGAIAIHCRMGLGRTGTLAGILLVERGQGPDEAIAAIRRARPGSIETHRQEAMIAGWRARR